MGAEGRDIPLVRETRLYISTDAGVTWVAWDGTGSIGGSGNGAILDGANTLIKASVLDLTNSNPVAVALVDANGDPYVAGGSSGLTDTQLRAAPVPVSVSGGATGAKQDTGNASLSSLDGKLTNPLPVSLPAGTVTTLTPPAAITGYSLESTQLLQATAGKQDTGNTSLSSIDGKLTNPLPVSLPAATVIALTPPAAITGFALESTQQLQATAANQATEIASLATIAALSKAEDSVHTSADPGVPIWAVRQDDPTILTSASGDYQAPTTDAFGRLWVNGSNVTQPVIDPVLRALEMRLVLMASAQPTNGFVPQEIPAFFAGF